MISKEKALSNIENFIEKSKRIRSYYSSEKVENLLNKSYGFIIFSSYIENTWVMNNGNRIDNFLKFYHLDILEKDKLTFFCHYFYNYFDFFELVVLDDKTIKYDIKDFFENGIYLRLSDIELQKIKIVPIKEFTMKDFWKYFYKGYMQDFFDCTYYTYYENIISKTKYIAERSTVLNTFSYLYSVLGDEFEIEEKMFQKKQKVSYIDFVISFYYIDFIQIEGIHYNTRKNGEKYTGYNIKLGEELKNILDEIEEQRDAIINKVFDEKYKSLKLKKKNGKPYLLEGHLEVIGDETKFVELRKQYPNSDINTKNYKGKTQKYEITEKIRLDNNEK